MNARDVCDACELTPGVVIANHLEALDHCPTTRAELRTLADAARLFERVLVPLDGQRYEFSRAAAPSPAP